MTTAESAGKIALERGATGVHYLLTLTAPDGSQASVIISRTQENETALEYFYAKLKDGLEV
jgi:hypothetical protein